MTTKQSPDHESHHPELQRHIFSTTYTGLFRVLGFFSLSIPLSPLKLDFNAEDYILKTKLLSILTSYFKSLLGARGL